MRTEKEKMENYRLIQQKLEGFIRKYYLNKLLRGGILFFAAGLLYFILMVGIEYFFWLNTGARSILFWLFILVEILLFYNFVLIPILKLLKFSKGISEDEASRIIGKHFPEVNDKLLNLLQLKNNSRQSELLLASIEQRSKELQPIPFTSAINYKSSLKYAKYAVFPVILILAVFFTGNLQLFADGYTRLSNYNTEYEAPAPFSFFIENDSLQVLENKSFNLELKTIGDVVPENVSIHFNDATYYLKSDSPGEFQYIFSSLKEDLKFTLSSNGVESHVYEIDVMKVPKLLNFELFLEYPAYTGKQDEKLNGTGNAKVPEGTVVEWKFKTQETDVVNLELKDTLVELRPENNRVSHAQRLLSTTEYHISSSNENVKGFEKLDYQIEIIKDEYPQIEIQHKTDSIDNKTKYFQGRVSDDYALSKLLLVYYEEGNKDSLITINIPVAREAIDEFLYTFPGNIELKRSKNYLFHFEVFDNDAVNGSKSSKSEVFSYRKRSLEELEEENLEQRGKSIENLNESLEEMINHKKELEELSRLHKEKKNLSYSDRKRLENFIERQKRQTEMMKSYSEKLKESFEREEEQRKDSDVGEELKERIERNEERLEENEELLKELKEYSDKINREELGEKLEKLSKNNQSEQRNLEQLLELTKRYYIEEKTQKLARDLQKISEKQERLSEKVEENNTESQEEISEEFEDFQEQMDELERENEGLQNPMDLDREKVDEESIKKDLEEAGKNLENEERESAKKKQKKAAKKMKEMSEKMQMQRAMQSGEQLDADIESLRQILDNLVSFSFEQEELLSDFKNIDQNKPAYAENLRRQSVLREHFRHIDDSLYTLALKNPMINEEITENLTDIEFDINKALERLSENQLPQGIASQQYVVTGANNLAYLLSNILSNLQQQANPQMGQGDGDSEEFQLPDLIEKQERLQQKMQEGMEKRQKNEQEGKEGQEGSSEEESGELYEIYKQQQELRNKLEDLMRNEGMGEGAEELNQSMQKLEEKLLDKGFDPQNLERMMDLKHELMKFQDARIEQGEDNRRTSETNEKSFENRLREQNLRAREYFNSTEILNRQRLPLRQIYKQKVKEYFEGGDD